MGGNIERGDIYWVELDPIRGAEIAKTRPCVVLSASEINLHRKTVIALPLTTTSAAAAPPLLVAVRRQVLSVKRASNTFGPSTKRDCNAE